jgi:N-acetylglucosamine-6-phosphate deacetylase
MSEFFDLQVNGYDGVDFNSDAMTAEQFAAACDSLREDGVSSFLPTIITDDLDAMSGRIHRLAEAVEADGQVARLVGGIHVEGPFISPVTGFVGAHPRDCVHEIDVDVAMRLVDAGHGLVRLVTLAPELPHADKLIRRLSDENIIVAAGHSDASLDDLRRAIDSGLKLFTHLGNGCPAQLHRHDNIIQRVLSLADQLAISLIADGHHIPAFALANYLRCIPESNAVIVTDAISAARLGPGTYRLAGQEVEVDESGAAWGAGRKNFAGCATTMPRMVEILREQVGCSETQIRKWTSENPRRLLGE